MPKLKNFYSFSTWNSTGKPAAFPFSTRPYKGVEMENSSERFSGLLRDKFSPERGLAIRGPLHDHPTSSYAKIFLSSSR